MSTPPPTPLSLYAFKRGVFVAYPFLLLFWVIPVTAQPALGFVLPRAVSTALYLLLLGIAAVLDKGVQRRGVRLEALVATGLLVVLAVSTALCTSPLLSMTGPPVFFTGTLFYFAVIGVYLVTRSLGAIASRPLIAPLLAPLSLLVIAEFLGFRPLALVYQAYDTAYPAVTIGYRGWVAGLQLLLVVSEAISIAKLDRDYISTGLGWRWAGLVLAVVALSCLSNSAGYIAYGLVIALLPLGAWQSKIRVKATLLLILTLTVPLLACFPLRTASKWLEHHHYVTHSADFKDLGSTTTFATRKLLWLAAYRAWQDKPLWGWGAGQYNTLWPKYLSKNERLHLISLEVGRPLKEIHVVAAGKVFDLKGKKIDVVQYAAPHNFVMEVLVNYGAAGLVMLALTLLAGGLSLWRLQKSTLPFLPFIAYGVYLLAWFPVVSVFALAAYLWAAALSDEQD